MLFLDFYRRSPNVFLTNNLILDIFKWIGWFADGFSMLLFLAMIVWLTGAQEKLLEGPIYVKLIVLKIYSVLSFILFSFLWQASKFENCSL